MKNSTRTGANRKRLQKIGVLVVFGIGVYLLLPQITALGNSWQVLIKMLPWAVGVSFLAQGLSYLGSGFLLKKTLQITRQGVSLLRSTLIVLGAASVSLVAGGTVGSSAAIFRWTSSKNGNVGSATLTSLLPSLFNSILLVLLSIFGLAHLLLVHDLTRVQLVGFIITLIFLGIVIAASFLASRYRARASAVIDRINSYLAGLRRKPFDRASTQKEIDTLFSAWDALWQGKWHLLMLGALLNVTFDMLTLYFLFIAAGHRITFGMLLSGYALPLLLGRLAFILPGGVGVVETSMAALYNGLGVPQPATVVVVLGYRLISFWIPSLVGFPIAAWLQRSRVKALKVP